MQVFPANNIWNTPVDTLPVHPSNAGWLNTTGPAAHLRLDDAIPITFGANIPLVALAGISSPESDSGMYAIPDNVLLEAGSDAHAVIVDTTTMMLYEVFGLAGSPGAWGTGGSAAKWDLASNALRTVGWTSADAAGLPIFPGIVRYQEILDGEITHCLRMSVPHSLYGGFGDPAGFVWPGRHYAAHNTNADPAVFVPMAQRWRLQASFDISGFSPRMQIVLRALKKYGTMVADNGLPWAMQIDGDSRWDLTELATLHNVLGSSMEAVDATALMSNSDSGAAADVGNQVLMTDKLGRANSVSLPAFSALLGIAGGSPPPPPPPTPTGTAVFVAADGLTAGSWRGVYGLDGRLIVGNSDSTPAYVSILPHDNSTFIWDASNTDPRALRKDAIPPAPPTIDRIAACWFNDVGFTIDLSFNDGKTHKVALYLLDWDSFGPRAEMVQVLDRSGRRLVGQPLTGFSGGRWLVWQMGGDVTIKLTNLVAGGGNAVISGLFFG